MARSPNPALARQLLEATLTLLDQRGLDGFGLREVAARVGYSVTAVYRCYGGRDDLIDALRGRLATGLALHLGVGDEGSARDQLIRFGRRFLSWAIDHPNRFSLLFGAPHTTTPRRSTAGPAIRALTAIITRGFRAEGLRRSDEHATAAMLFALLSGMASLALGGELSAVGYEDPHRLIERGVETWVDRVVHFERDRNKPIG